MAWITLTENDVVTKLSAPELAALKTAALQTEQTDPLPEVIAQVVSEVRGYVAACERNVLGTGSTIPDELLGAAINRIRFELATRLPVRSLLTEERVKANDQAITLLRDAAACRFLVTAPETAAPDQPGGPAVEIVSKSRRRFTRHQLEGL